MGFKSFFVLGFYFFVHLLKKMFFLYQPGGETRLLENFREDRILPVSAEDRAVLAAWQRCTACGLCQAACPSLIGTAERPNQWLDINSLIQCQWRDPTAVALVREKARALAECKSCQACEDACPERIPLRALARSMAGQA
jgi:formate hydrogenlyase subunit 6/NADH:ubiquinone oxidoreductase subunit I